MTMTGTPSKFHAAFNPIIFEVTKSIDSETSASLSIYDEYGSLVTTLTRAFYGSKTKFDVSGVVSKMFSVTEPSFVSGLAVDKRLFVKYQVGGVWYFAINAAIEMGLPSSFLGQVGAILTMFSTARLYEGYPFDISVLADISFAGLTAESVNRIQNVESFVEGLEGTEVYLADNSSDFILDNLMNYILLSRTGGVGVGSSYTVENCCLPVNPFYVRWANPIGGVDYWMFSVYQEIKTSLKSSSSYRKFYTDTEAEKGSAVVYAQEAEDTITAGANDLTNEQYKALSLIPYSPLIEWYNEDTRNWVRLTVDKEDNTRKPIMSKQEVSITFILPQRNLQV